MIEVAIVNPMTVKGSQERRIAAQHLKRVRIHERGRRYNTLRSAASYDAELCGYENFLAYAKRVQGSNLVLDIGAGRTRAVSEIAKGSSGKGLRFKATTLMYWPEIDSYLGPVDTIITSAEVMRGIEPQSVAGVMAVYSITYSALPEIVVDNIDRILVPGGVFKGKFIKPRGDTNGRLSSDPERFKKEFRRLGYDIYDTLNVVLAIKSGGERLVTSRELFQADLHNKRLRWTRRLARGRAAIAKRDIVPSDSEFRSAVEATSEAE